MRKIGEKLGKREPTQFPGVYSRKATHRRGKHKGKVDTVFDVSLKDTDGKKAWKKVGWALDGVSAKLAVQYRGEWVRKVRLGEELPWKKKANPRFSEMAESYLEWAKENKRDSRNDESRYDNHLKESLGKKRMTEISSFRLEGLKSELIKKDLSPATIKHCLVLVREIFNKADEWGKYHGTNPIKGVKLPSLNNRRERFLSHEEAGLLLEKLQEVSTKDKRVHDMALLSLHCGLRFGEIANLRGQDIDLENGVIRIIDPKNKTNRAAFPTEDVKTILKDRLPEDPAELIFKDRWHGEGIREVSRTFERAVESLGFNKGIQDRRQRVVFHTLRHSFASWLAIQGTPLHVIKELMGHKTLSMTERYAHLIPDVKREATRALEAGFNAARGGKVVSIEEARKKGTIPHSAKL